MSDRGVSEALGFVLVFALVTATIGIVYATGISSLHAAQQAEKVNNVERAFDVFADNVEDLHRSGTPSRATEVKLAGGALGTGEPVVIQVAAVQVGSPSRNATYSVSYEPVVYEAESGTKLSYTGGAVVRSNSRGAVMLSEPGWIVGPNRSVIPLISTHGGDGGVAGEGAVLIVAQRRSRSLQGPFEAGTGSTVRVNVTVTSPRVAVWKQYMEDQGYDPVDASVDNSNVTYQFETDTLYVPKTAVRVEFDR